MFRKVGLRYRSVLRLGDRGSSLYAIREAAEHAMLAGVVDAGEREYAFQIGQLSRRPRVSFAVGLCEAWV